MKTGDAEPQDPIPHERLAEAGVWLARLHGDDRNRELEAGVREWLRANPMNVRAFQLATDVWEESQNLRRVVPFAHEVPKPTHRPRNRIGLAAAALTATLLLVLVLGRLLTGRSEAIVTRIGEQRMVTLEDGSRIFLNTQTRVVVSYDRAVRQVELQSGEVLIEVAKHSEWPFFVQVGNRKVRALGTSFAVRYEEQQTAVTLVEGKVSVSGATAGDPPIVMAPGQRVTFVARKPARLDTPSVDETTAWRRGQVILDATPLSEAVAEMNRYSTVKLVIEQPAAASLLVNGLFQTGDSTNFATAVAETYGLHIAPGPDEIVLQGLPRAVSPAIR